MNWTHGNGFVRFTDLSWSRRMTVLNRHVPSGLPTADASSVEKATPAKVTLETVIAEVTRRRDEFQRVRHVPRDMIEIMKKAGIFRASTPKCFGGDALPPADFLRTLECIAVADGSAAWVAAFGSANIYYAALPRQTQAEIYASGPDQLFAGGLYPMQMARTVPGGYVATGRWRFASGCMGADWLSVGIGVEQLPDDAGNKRPPRLLIAVAPANEIEIVDNWDVVVMQGTGSHDLRLQDKFIPEAWTCARGTGAVIDEPLYRYPAVAYQAAVHAACNVGLARAALDIAASMADGTAIMPGAARLADRSYFRIELAKSEAKWRSARAFFYEAPEQAWETIVSGDPLGLEQANMLRIAATWAAHSCAEVVQQCYRISGMSAIQQTHRMQLIVRDAMVVTQHAALSEGTYESAGTVLAGLPPPAGFP
jgi:alkylation response protein AidB-like acyl-CoA dehydrogenase